MNRVRSEREVVPNYLSEDAVFLCGLGFATGVCVGSGGAATLFFAGFPVLSAATISKIAIIGGVFGGFSADSFLLASLD